MFDRSLRPNWTNAYNGEEWETAVTDFELVCEMDWFNALLEAMGLFGLFLGAFVAGMYNDRFGRKNGMLVWTTVELVCVTTHAFMPEKYSFLVMRVLGNGSHVSHPRREMKRILVMRKSGFEI